GVVPLPASLFLSGENTGVVPLPASPSFSGENTGPLPLGLGLSGENTTGVGKARPPREGTFVGRLLRDQGTFVGRLLTGGGMNPADLSNSAMTRMARRRGFEVIIGVLMVVV